MRSLVAIISLLLAAGCARFDPRPLAPNRSAAELEERSLTNQALKTYLSENLGRDFPDWPPASWDLEMLGLAAFYYNPTLEVARAQWHVAQGERKTAAQRPNPTLNLTPGYDTSTFVPSPWFPLTSLDVPIETAGKRRHRRDRAAHLAEAARQKIVLAAWQIRADLRSSVLDLATADKKQDLLQKQAALQEKVRTAIDQQVGAGALSPAEAFPYRLELQRSQLDLAEARRQRAEARARLAATLGVPVRALEGIRIDFDLAKQAPQLADWTSSDARNVALQSRADILGALAEYAASQAALQLEVSKQYPDVHLQPGYQFDQGDHKWSLGLLVELPVLNQNQGLIAEARARREEAAARFLEVQAKVMSELDRALELLRYSRENLVALQALAEGQEKRERALAAQTEAGEIEPVDFMRAQFEAASAALVVIDGQLKYQQAVAALEDALKSPANLPPALFQSARTDARRAP